MSSETKKDGTLPKKFKQNYSEFVIDKNVNYLIDDCEEIGIKDPFNEENDASC